MIVNVSLTPGRRLQPLGHEMADIGRIRQIAFHQQIELARGRIDLRDLLDIADRRVRDLVGLAELAFDHDEDGLHRALPIRTGTAHSTTGSRQDRIRREPRSSAVGREKPADGRQNRRPAARRPGAGSRRRRRRRPVRRALEHRDIVPFGRGCGRSRSRRAVSGAAGAVAVAGRRLAARPRAARGAGVRPRPRLRRRRGPVVRRHRARRAPCRERSPTGIALPISFSIAATDLPSSGRGQREGAALPAGAAGAADAVDIILGVVRHVEIEDVRQALDVEPARRDIAGTPAAGFRRS